MEQNQDYDEISIKELITTLIKNKNLILTFIIASIILAGAVSWYMDSTSKEARLMISINHTKINEGKNPDGSTFNAYDIASPYILNDLIEELNIEGQISPNDIRKNFSIEPVIPEEIIKQEEFLIEKEGESFTYFPNQFILKIGVDKNAGISPELAERIGNQVVESYISYFSTEYVNARPVTNKLITFSTDDYDYSDVSNVLHNQLDTLLAYNSKLNQAGSEFRSKTTGLSFNDIVQTISIIDEIDLNRIDSLISSYKLTKDKEKLIINYEYLIEKLEFERNKQVGSKGVTEDMLTKVDNTNNRILGDLIGNQSDSGDSYFSSLILSTYNTGADVADLQENIEYYKKELEEIQTGNYVVQIDQSKSIQEVTELIDNTVIALKDWIKISNATSEEFYEKLMTRAITPLSPAEIYSNVNMKLNLAIGTVLGIMLGAFVAFFKEYWENA